MTIAFSHKISAWHSCRPGSFRTISKQCMYKIAFLNDTSEDDRRSKMTKELILNFRVRSLVAQPAAQPAPQPRDWGARPLSPRPSTRCALLAIRRVFSLPHLRESPSTASKASAPAKGVGRWVLSGFLAGTAQTSWSSIFANVCKFHEIPWNFQKL